MSKDHFGICSYQKSAVFFSRKTLRIWLITGKGCLWVTASHLNFLNLQKIRLLINKFKSAFLALSLFTLLSTLSPILNRDHVSRLINKYWGKCMLWILLSLCVKHSLILLIIPLISVTLRRQSEVDTKRTNSIYILYYIYYSVYSKSVDIFYNRFIVKNWIT